MRSTVPIALQLDCTHAHLPVLHAAMRGDEWLTLSGCLPPMLCLRISYLSSIWLETTSHRAGGKYPRPVAANEAASCRLDTKSVDLGSRSVYQLLTSRGAA